MGSELYPLGLSIPHQLHLFRYPSEWDPRKPGSSKGGYLEGSIQLPKNFPGDLRIVMTTVPDHDVQGGVRKEIADKIRIY